MLVLFYLTTTLLFYYVFTVKRPDLIGLPLFGISFAASVALALISRICNVSRLVLFGFVQPLISVTVLALLGLVAAEDLILAAGQLFRDGMTVGLFMAAGGLSAVVLTAVTPSSRRVVFTWHSISDVQLQRWEGVALRAAAVATPIISLWSLLWSK